MRSGMALAAAFALAGCVHGKCVASTPGVHGSVSQCCSSGSETRYYWSGTRCEADLACECDAQPASPTWGSLAQCEEVHHRCGDFDKD